MIDFTRVNIGNRHSAWPQSMYLSDVTVKGFRASVDGEISCAFPGRISVLVGANNLGKTTICDALYLAHPQVFPRLHRPSIAALGPRPRIIAIKFDHDLAKKGRRWCECFIVHELTHYRESSQGECFAAATDSRLTDRRASQDLLNKPPLSHGTWPKETL
jgi:predicted ATPase